MRKPRTAIVLVAALIIVASFGGRAGLAAKPNQAAVSTEIQKVSHPVAGAENTAIASEKACVVPVGAQILALDLPKSAPHRLSDDGTALVAEMCDLQLLAQGTRLNLNSRQWSAFASVVLRNQAVRQNYEAQIATSTLIAPGQYRVEIPVYASAGDLLRDKFNTELRSELGEGTASDILTKIGDRLEARFAGFGVSVQTLDITANPGAALSEVQVTRTVTYWNSVDGSDRLTTRREIHFPAWEDPTGDSWSALLAMVKA